MTVRCDLCGGPLTMAENGKSAVCKICGMEHSLDRLRAKMKAEQAAAAPAGEEIRSLSPLSGRALEMLEKTLGGGEAAAFSSASGSGTADRTGSAGGSSMAARTGSAGGSGMAARSGSTSGSSSLPGGGKTSPFLASLTQFLRGKTGSTAPTETKKTPADYLGSRPSGVEMAAGMENQPLTWAYRNDLISAYPNRTYQVNAGGRPIPRRGNIPVMDSMLENRRVGRAEVEFLPYNAYQRRYTVPPSKVYRDEYRYDHDGNEEDNLTKFLSRSPKGTREEVFFERLFQTRFSSYEIERNLRVRPTEDRDPRNRYEMVDFLFQKDGAPLLAVFVTDRGRYERMSMKNILNYLPSIGIPAIVFFTEMPNYETYVTCRVQDYLTNMEKEVRRVAWA